MIKPRTIVFGMGFGVFFTMISAIIPAVRAARVPPVAALRETSVGFSKPLRKRVIAGVGITAVGLAMLFAGLFGKLLQGGAASWGSAPGSPSSGWP